MIFIVLPAYNEAVALPRLLARIAAVSDAHFAGQLHVIVANDGSTDGTPTWRARRQRRTGFASTSSRTRSTAG